MRNLYKRVLQDNRNYGCRIDSDITYRGQRVLVMQNEFIRLSILLDKGTDIYELLYKPKDIDFLWRSPFSARNVSQMRFPGQIGNAYESFMLTYQGGWQELFPSASGSSFYRGVTTGFHGEVAHQPWDFQVLTDTPELIEVCFFVRTTRTPFFLEKRIRMESKKPLISLKERIVNYGDTDLHFMWGHHPSFGAPFLSGNCILSLPECEVNTLAYQQENANVNHLFAPNERFHWPYATDKLGNSVDLRKIPDKRIRASDMLFARNFREGWFALTNQELGVGIGMVWPVEMYPYMWIWREFGGTLDFPWYGKGYVLAVEPFTSLPDIGEHGLLESINNGTAAVISAHEEIEKELKVVIFESSLSVKRIDFSGEIEFENNSR